MSVSGPDMAENAAIAAPYDQSKHWRPVRLATLTRLRWLALAGQSASVALVAFGLQFALPLAPSLTAIALSAAFNVLLQWRFGSTYRLTDTSAALLLGFDLMQLSFMLWLTGGLQNPFALLLLAPVSVAATTLSLSATVALSALAMVLASALAITHLPLPWSSEAPLVLPQFYSGGIWVALLLGTVFIAAYTNRVAHEARQLANALATTELALSRQQQLRALDGLAAAAAHELGTPLSTIALAAREMREEAGLTGPAAEDLDLILSQIARCRAILGKLRDLEQETGDPFARVTLTALLAELGAPYEGRRTRIAYESHAGAGGEPVVARSVGLMYGLGNLMENASQFARAKVVIETRWDEDEVVVTITDDGPGFPPELMARLGEPYVTRRVRDGAAPGGGLGLGVFIARTLLERGGATLGFTNRSAEGHARVTIRWPRTALTTPGATI